MMKYLAIVIATLLNMGCSNAGGESLFKITTKRDNDKVEVRIIEGNAVISVRSPFGISQAIIERVDRNWPDTVTLQLHLKGMEHFKVTSGTVTLEASVSSQDGRVRLWMVGEENSPLDMKCLHWMEIRMLGHDGKPTTSIPLTDGYFMMQLPQALIEGNPKSITVNWIDFYR